jgi:uncharacterized protein YceK
MKILFIAIMFITLFVGCSSKAIIMDKSDCAKGWYE